MRKPVWGGLAVATTLFALLTSGGEAAGGTCGVTITGARSAERAAARTVVCGMPGTEVRSIQIFDQPPDAPSDAVWLAIYIPRATGQTLRAFVTETRGKWDADIAAAAIRDSFARAGLRRVVAYGAIPPGVKPDPNTLYGIALPKWGITRWTTGAPSRNLGKHGDTWPILHAKLKALALRYHVKTTLVRLEPLGKAPLVWISTPKAARFLTSGGFEAYERTLHLGEARYDGVFIGLVSQPVAAFAAWATYRGRQGSGCGSFHRIRGADRLCPSD